MPNFICFHSFCPKTAGKEGVSTVAVKMLKKNATEIDRNDLYSELHVSYSGTYSYAVIRHWQHIFEKNNADDGGS